MSMQKKARESFYFCLTPDLNYSHVDAGKEQLLKLPAGSLAGESLFHCMHPDDAAMLRALCVPQGHPHRCKPEHKAFAQRQQRPPRL